MVTESNVSVSDVRTALNEVDASQLSDAVIQQKIDDAELDIDAPDPSLDDGEALRDRAVRQQAAFEAFTTSPPQTQKSAIEASASWNVELYMTELKDRMNDALASLGDTEGGTSAAFFKTTDGPI